MRAAQKKRSFVQFLVILFFFLFVAVAKIPLHNDIHMVRYTHTILSFLSSSLNMNTLHSPHTMSNLNIYGKLFNKKKEEKKNGSEIYMNRWKTRVAHA